MASFQTTWVNFKYDLSLCRNYRNLKSFVEHQALESWIWFPKRFEYLDQIKFFSKIDLKEYYPDKNLDDFLEKIDAPLPVYDKHFFSHLPLQLSFTPLLHIKNILDHHFRMYMKYKPEYEEAFLRVVEYQVVNVIEHNQINKYNEIAALVLGWIRHKGEFLEIKKSQQKFVQIIKNEFVDLSITIINQVTNNNPTNNQNDVPKTSEPPTKKKADLIPTGIKIGIKTNLIEDLIVEVFDLVEAPAEDLNLFKAWIMRMAEGKPANKKYPIKNRQISNLCFTFKRYYDTKKAFPGVPKTDLARWIVSNFIKNSPKKDPTLSYTTIYNLLRGSKKRKVSNRVH